MAEVVYRELKVLNNGEKEVVLHTEHKTWSDGLHYWAEMGAVYEVLGAVEVEVYEEVEGVPLEKRTELVKEYVEGMELEEDEVEEYNHLKSYYVNLLRDKM